MVVTSVANPTLRIVAIVSVSLITLCVVGYFIFVAAFPVSRIASLLADQVKTATGRDFHVNGELSIRLFPTLAVVANDVVLSNAEWGTHPEMLRFHRAAFEVALRPLLDGEIRVLDVTVDGAEVLLETDGRGNANWVFSTGKAVDRKQSGPAIDLARLAITNALITYREGGSGMARKGAIEKLTLLVQGNRDQLSARLEIAGKQVQIDGPVGRLLTLLEGASDWPFDLQLNAGGTVLHANGSLTLKPELRLDGRITSPMLDLGKLIAPAAADAPKADVPSFADSALPLDALPAFSVRLDFQIDNLNLPGVPPLSALSGHLASDPGRLVIEPLTVSVASGEIKARLDVASPVKAVLNIDAQGLSVEALETHLRGTRFFRGGRADLKANLQLSGSTPRKMFASPNGAVILSVSHAHLSGSAAAVDQGILTTLLQALIPGRPIKQEMNIQCAVLRLPLVRGVALIDRSIAMETDELAIAASGKVDLAAQTLVLAFKPQAKSGLEFSQSGLAKMVVLKGPLQHPEVALDPEGAMREVATIGVAVATGGISLLATNLLNEKGDTHVCRSAMSVARPAQAKAARNKVLDWPLRKIMPQK